jgi:D-alanyl-D-alanine carboxypeptidase
VVAAGLVFALTGCAAPRVVAVPTPRVVQHVSAPSRSATPTPTPTPTFDRSAQSLDDPSSVWVIVDKVRPLQPKSWRPKDLVPVDVPHTNPPILRRPAAEAAVRMFAGAAKVGVHLASNSSYRPYTDQKRIFRGDVAHLGRKGADRLTLRPGYSEHQTGLAMDIGVVSGACSLDPCFGTSRASRWLDAHSWQYGYVLRYPKGQEQETGIEWEPWHFRYVGASLAAEYHRSGAVTLESFFGLPASPDYR